MDITLSISPSIVQPGQVISGQIHLARGASANEIHLSPLQRLLQARPNTPLPDLNISVRLTGRAQLRQEEIVIILQASPVSIITNCSFRWESRLPSANLLPSFNNGRLLRSGYFVEVRLEHPDKVKSRVFRLPITVMTARGVSDLDMPASPYFADWMRISESADSDPEPDKKRASVYIPPEPSEPDSMMEERLAELEKMLRAEIDRLGMKQPDKDWHYDDPSLYNNDDEEDVGGLRPLNPQEYRIDFNAEPFLVLLLTHNQFHPAEVVRGKFTFEDEAFHCVFVQVRLVSCEYEIENDKRIREVQQIWQEVQLLRTGLWSDDFALSLPFGPEACANFRTPVVGMQWQLLFQFALSKDAASDADLSPRVLSQIIERDQLKTKFDVLEWELNLDVVNRYRKSDEWSRRKLTFQVLESDLAEFQIKR